VPLHPIQKLLGFFVLPFIGVALIPFLFFLAFQFSPSVPKYQVNNFSRAMANLGRADLVLKIEDQNIRVPKSIVASWKEPYTRDYSGQEDTRFSPALTRYVANLASSTGTEPVNARFRFENGKVSLFRPSQDGLRLDITEATSLIQQTLLRGQHEADLPVHRIPAALTLDTINNLGINALLSKGVSDFSGSSAARIQNIRISSNKFNGLLLKPNEQFSFNDVLGEVEAAQGYAAEKVIKSNKLVYEYGGGICQVSTTLFRAAILSGFPIIERRPHSFPVKYYNPQGFDSTVYPGVTDLKFVNDSPSHVLLQTRIEGHQLIFEIYGTDDGRNVALQGPYQYDEKPDGSMKAYFVRTVTADDGTSKEEKFYSTYKSPALYPLEERNPLE